MGATTLLYYIYDPMCSWCYAFNQSWLALQRKLPDEVQRVSLLGGLAPDTTEPMPPAVQNNIQQAWRRIEQTVPGIRFNWEFWLRNTPIRSTYPACRAVLAAKKQRPEAELAMVQAIQKAYYQEAKNPALRQTLQQCAIEIGLNTENFISDLISTVIDNELQQNIQMARSMDVFSYPSLRLMHGGNVYPVTVDYQNYQPMLQEIEYLIRDTHLVSGSY